MTTTKSYIWEGCLIDASNASRNNHYVPQFYLKNWSVDGHTIMVYRKLVSHKNVPWWGKQSISSTASVQYLYARANAEHQMSDEFEKWINSEIENPAQPAFESVHNDRSISNDDLKRLVRFAAVQLVRTPAFFVSFNELYKETAWNVLSKFKFETSRPKPLSQEQYQFDIPVSIERAGDSTIKLTIAGGRRPWLSLVKRVAYMYIAHLENNKWHIVKMHQSVTLPTSDNPVVVVRNKKPIPDLVKTGITIKGTEFILPLSPSVILCSCVGYDTIPINLNENLSFSLSIYHLTLENAFSEVYALSKLKYMFRDCPRIVSQTHYDEYSNFLKMWNEANMQIETEYK